MDTGVHQCVDLWVCGCVFVAQLYFAAMQRARIDHAGVCRAIALTQYGHMYHTGDK